MIRYLAPVAALLLLAGCETPTVYQAAEKPGAVGYSDTRIEPGRYRVTFQGGGGAPPQQVEDYALRHAAEITVREGYDWFRVTERSGERRPPRSGSTVSVGVGGGNFGRGGGFGVGYGTAFDLSGGPVVSRSIEVLMGKGPKPADPDAYDAQGVLHDIQPPPPPPHP